MLKHNSILTTMNSAIQNKQKLLHSKLWKWIWTFLLLFLGAAFTWSRFGFPYSVAEAAFLSNLAKASASDAQRIDLAVLMSGKWEMVCESNGYDEPLFVKKYNKSFPVAGQSQDGAWGLIFIEPNGAYTSASSSCGKGTHIIFSIERCLPREKALLNRESKSGLCEKFVSARF